MSTAPSAPDELVVSLERSLEELLPTKSLLDAAASDATVLGARHADLVGLGLLEVAVPEPLGGLGLDDRSIAAIWYAAGRRLLPVALREEALTLVPLLAAAAPRDDRAAAALAALRAGTRSGGGRVAPEDLPAAGEALVWCAPGASAVALLGRDRALVYEIVAGDLVARTGLDLGQGLAVLGCDGRTAGLRLDGDVVRRAWSRAQLAMLAEATGAAERALEIAVAFAGAREQFGRPIAQFQAVAHRLADMRVAVDAGRSTLARLAALDDGPAREDLLAVGRYALPLAAREVCEGAIQVHGGTGFSWEYGLHLYYRRVLQTQAALGGAAEAAERLGARYLAQTRR